LKACELEEIENSKILSSLNFYMKTNLELDQIDSNTTESSNKELLSGKYPAIENDSLSNIAYYNSYIEK